MSKGGSSSAAEYRYDDAGAPHTHEYLWASALHQISLAAPKGARVFDLGCGNGSLLLTLRERGFLPTGVDPSESGIAQAKQACPGLDAYVGSAYDDLASRFGQFPVVVSLEVVEHVYAPRNYPRCVYTLLEPGGTAIISTPYHGYVKNLLLAVTGKLDAHFGPLWDHGHIKFWSVRTLRLLLHEAGFTEVTMLFAGRFYPFSKSMIAVARRPS